MSDIEIQVRSRDDKYPRVVDYAQEKVAAALRHSGQPILFARVWLDRIHDPAVARPAEASVEVDVNGTVVRARADAATQVEAIDLMQDQLKLHLDRTTR